jgi:hypothetical protein
MWVGPIRSQLVGARQEAHIVAWFGAARTAASASEAAAPMLAAVPTVAEKTFGAL